MTDIDATPEEIARELDPAPGSIPGLRRRCSPVFNTRDGIHGTVVETATGELAVYAETDGDGSVHSLEDVWGLDLTHETGRHHAELWLGARDWPPPRATDDTNPLRLPDGSRWVDVVVLLYVVKYVATSEGWTP